VVSMNALRYARFNARLARAFADEAVRIALDPMPCEAQMQTAEREAYALRSLEHWTQAQRDLERLTHLQPVWASA